MNIERSVGDRTSTSSPGAAVMVASSQSDADAVAAVVRHHAELAGTLALLADSLLTTAADETGDGAGSVTPARARLADFCLSDLLPHAAAEEATLYPAAASGERARLLVEAMVAEHRVLEGLVDEVRTTESPVRAAAAANALRVLFDMHLAKENDLILPLLAADPSVSLAALPAGMHELLGASDQHAREDVCWECGPGPCSGNGRGRQDRLRLRRIARKPLARRGGVRRHLTEPESPEHHAPQGMTAAHSVESPAGASTSCRRARRWSAARIPAMARAAYLDRRRGSVRAWGRSWRSAYAVTASRWAPATGS